jgi:transcriptional regulator with XRE-family HTH domain
MAQSTALVAALKRELKARGITYATLAQRMRLSEASVKRMFSRGDFTLKRLDAVCECAGLELSDLARTSSRTETLISRLTPEQEREILADRKLFLVAVCVLNHVTFEQIVATYEITPAECVRLLMRLDRLRVIELKPGNRIRLLVSRTFTWHPDGPILRFFQEQAQNEYFRSRFEQPDELLLVVNGMLSKGSSLELVNRLKRIGREFSELHNDDLRLPLAQRSAMSVVLALRHWELEAFRALRRRSPAREPPPLQAST